MDVDSRATTHIHQRVTIGGGISDHNCQRVNKETGNSVPADWMPHNWRESFQALIDLLERGTSLPRERLRGMAHFHLAISNLASQKKICAGVMSKFAMRDAVDWLRRVEKRHIEVRDLKQAIFEGAERVYISKVPQNEERVLVIETYDAIFGRCNDKGENIITNYREAGNSGSSLNSNEPSKDTLFDMMKESAEGVLSDDTLRKMAEFHAQINEMSKDGIIGGDYPLNVAARDAVSWVDEIRAKSCGKRNIFELVYEEGQKIYLSLHKVFDAKDRAIIQALYKDYFGAFVYINGKKAKGTQMEIGLISENPLHNELRWILRRSVDTRMLGDYLKHMVGFHSLLNELIIEGKMCRFNPIEFDLQDAREWIKRINHKNRSGCDTRELIIEEGKSVYLSKALDENDREAISELLERSILYPG